MTTKEESPGNLSHPVVRGKRLERVRLMTGLDRQAFAARHGMSDGTLRSWESGRYAGLTEKGAKQMVKCFELEGVQCTENWLLQGVGSIPVVLEQSFIKAGLISRDASSNIPSTVYAIEIHSAAPIILNRKE